MHTDQKTPQSEIDLLDQLDQRVKDLLARTRFTSQVREDFNKLVDEHVADAAERNTLTGQFLRSLRLISAECFGEFDPKAAKDAILRTSRLNNTERED